MCVEPANDVVDVGEDGHRDTDASSRR
jgi:hypothetical protein